MATPEDGGAPPFTDYSRTFHGAEEVASAAVDAILTGGGTILWQKYLERKAFVFAENTMNDSVLSHLGMCFVAHDEGEETLDDPAWELEDEPVPKEIDSWARMRLPVRRKGVDDEAANLAGRKKKLPNAKSRITGRSGPKDPSKASEDPSKSGSRTDSRMTALPEVHDIDDEEERLRAQKAEEKQRVIERDNKIKAAEKLEEQERQRIQILHEQMDRQLHTFDSEGNIIWIEEPKHERLPKVQETFPYNIKKDTRARATEDTRNLASTMLSSGGFAGTAAPNPRPGSRSSAKSKKKPDSKKGARTSKVDEHEFTDFFAKLQHGQPSIMETMVVKSGVTLETGGKKKPGPADGRNRQLTRKEYLTMADQEVGASGQGGYIPGGSASGGNSARGGDVPPAGDPPPGPIGGSPRPVADAVPDGVPPSVNGEGANPLGQTGGVALPPINPVGGGGGEATLAHMTGLRGAAGNGGGPGEKNGEIRKAPPAPMTHFKSKFDSIGHLARQPRYHRPLLGGPYVSTGSVQPPIGATMGHGLMHSNSTKEAFYYPPAKPEPPQMPRATSEGALRQRIVGSTSAGASPTPQGSRSQVSSRMGDRTSNRGDASLGGSIDNLDGDPRHGVIFADKKTSAYRMMIGQLSGTEKPPTSF
mmetsp:Transcript_17607/g.48324  ORF Transcript_17607/g.48324 Transcript_17607/m.48324 type:complete len:645 (+) Transcript_17607:111-2045(+)